MKAEKLKEYRISLGLTLKELAIKSGISHTTLSRYEKSNDCWKKYTTKRIETALNIKFDDDNEESASSNPFEKYSTEDLLDELKRRLVG